ncbi:MAG TPA: HAMP domain-containing sensor histidine kinase [Candidatus Sulfotelmatobacter sp.]|nr:HAMP domain-containing sensor histidine kinase [Candidatus Sulfotelmatobacter sp.]
MREPLLVLQLGIQIAFALLAIRTAASWVREPDARHGYLALALGALALLFLVSPALGGAGPGAQVVTDLAALLFLLSGYGLLMFRDTFLPFDRRAPLLILAGILVVGVVVIVAGVPASPQGAHTPVQQAALLAIVSVWAVCLCEPMIRFWAASIGRPPVENHRLRALSLGYAALLAAVLIGTLTSSVDSAPVSLVVDLLTLSIVPLLYLSFFPPVWVRRVWRQSEEDQFRHALHDLLLYSPDRVTLASRALGWAARLVGGDTAYVVDADGSILAARGISAEDAEREGSIEQLLAAARDRQAPIRRGAMLVLPLDLQAGRGAIVIRSGRLSPLFGDDELSRLRQYSGSISAGLDRVSLTARVRALEQAKSEFLSVASHELRGPMTVIKGYLTMLEAGSLGALPPRAETVMPLLISKSDEVSWMLEQMVEASRLEEGRLALKKRRLDIVDLTFAAVDGVKMLITGHEVNCVQPGGRLEADVDPDRFSIVVRNMLTNAAKYSPSGTQISVEVRRAGGEGIVSVADQGVGISPENQAHLFTRFGRIESTQHVHGTGLGLWLSREIARMHDGDLTVESSVGRGSTFAFHLPLAG